MFCLAPSPHCTALQLRWQRGGLRNDPGSPSLCRIPPSTTSCPSSADIMLTSTTYSSVSFHSLSTCPTRARAHSFFSYSSPPLSPSSLFDDGRKGNTDQTKHQSLSLDLFLSPPKRRCAGHVIPEQKPADYFTLPVFFIIAFIHHSSSTLPYLLLLLPPKRSAVRAIWISHVLRGGKRALEAQVYVYVCMYN